MLPLLCYNMIIIEIMRMCDLYIANTHYEPKRGESPHTCLCPKPKSPCAQGDFGLHVDEQVSCHHEGKNIKGEVIAVEQGKQAKTMSRTSDQFYLKTDTC